jgi:hypothetical protein
MGKTVLKQLSFELRFDDPRLPTEESRLSIRGDRDQLEALCDAVTSYIQQFLQQSPESFWVNLSGPQDSSKVADDSELTDFHPSLAATKTLKAFNSYLPETQIHLEPSSYLTHSLFLGSLANQASGPVIQLSLLQLFDLATALDEYSADVMALPTLNNSRISSFSWQTWAPVAAVLVIGVGLLPVTWQYVNNGKAKQQIAKKPTSESAQIPLQNSPLLDFPTPQPGLTSPDTLQQQPIAGSNPQFPTTNLPAPPLNPPNSNLSANSPTLPNSSFSTTSQTAPNSNLPNVALPSPGSVLSIPQKTNSTFPTNSQFTAPGTTGDQKIALQPNPGQNPARSVTQGEITLPKKRELPPSLSPSRTGVTPNISTVAPPLATIPNVPTNPRNLQEELNSASNTSSVTGNDNSLVEKLRGGGKTTTSTNVATDSTLFDTPQVTEAREYFKKRWQPPAGLKRTLEYSLMIGVDGTIERIFPLNKAAREYVDSAGMPVIGTPFISPNRYGRNARMRAVLSPNGKVQVFPETE